MTGFLAGLRTNARQLAVARILIGVNAAFAALEAARMLPRLLTPIVVKVPFSPLVPVLPSSALVPFIAVWLLAAAAFALGWKTRAAGSVLALVTGYTLVMDQQTYSNHLYLLFLVILLLTVADSGAAWSLDMRLATRDARLAARSEVAGWPVLLLKIQVTLVYFFSALAKITPQYLSGEVLSRSLKQGGWLAVPESWRTPEAMNVLAVASIAAELFIAFGLWTPRLRFAAIVAGAGFHLLILAVLDSSRLSLGIFALAMFAVYLLFWDRKPAVSPPPAPSVLSVPPW